MGNETGHDPVTIDVTPQADNHSAPASQPNSVRLALIMAVLALVVVFAGLFGAYFYTQKTAQDLAAINAGIERNLQAHEKIREQLQSAQQVTTEHATLLQAQTSHIEQQQESINLAQKTFVEQEKLLGAERQRMQQREAELRASVADVHRRIGASGNQWVIAEAAYLLRIANHRLSLARDVDTAFSALKLADQRLRDTQEPGWNAVREQIALDLGKLEKVNLPDLPGIAARLISLIEQTAQLPLDIATSGVQPPKPESTNTPVEQRNWDTLLDDLWQGFHSAVRVRRNDQPIQVMLPPEQRFFLYEKLRQHLEVARLAVVRLDTELYRESLHNVHNWLNLYFDQQDAATQRMQKAVGELSAIDIQPDLPDITESLNALQARRQLNHELALPLPGTDKAS